MKITSFYMLLVVIAFSCNGQLKSQENRTSLDAKAKIIHQDSKGNYWFASEEKGLFLYNGDTFSNFKLENITADYRILSVQEDASGNIYFDSPAGVLKFDWQSLQSIPLSKTIRTDWTNINKPLWFRAGWNHDGPFLYDGDSLIQMKLPRIPMEAEFRAKYPNVSFDPYGIYYLFKDSKDHLWMGTSSFGIFHFDGKKIRWMYEDHLTETPNGGAFGIRSIAEDLEGNYWICNANYKYHIGSISSSNIELIYTKKTGFPGQENLYFMQIIPDKNGNLWMQTFDQGLWKNDGEQLAEIKIDYKGKNYTPTSIFIDNNDLIWLGTNNDGLFKFDGNRFQKF